MSANKEPSTGSEGEARIDGPGTAPTRNRKRERSARARRRRRGRRVALTSCILFAVLAGCAALWLANRALEIKSQLSSAVSLAPEIKLQIAAKNQSGLQTSVLRLQQHARAAKEAARDPLWRAAGKLPLLGQNFEAVSGVADSVDFIATEAGEPFLRTVNLLTSDAMKPVNGRFNVTLLADLSRQLTSAKHTLKRAESNLQAIDRRDLLPAVSVPLEQATQLLKEAHDSVGRAADVSTILPTMMGSAGPRNYLVLVQNLAEVRSTGGLPGALAVIRVENGKIDLTAQSSGAAMGKFDPAISIDPVQERIYTSRMGTYISDVNLTPDFPTAAQTAKAMWEARHGTIIDSVIALDPVVLSHVLEATGPIKVPTATDSIAPGKLPTTLTAKNVVKVLLADVYAGIDGNTGQDQFFASAAERIFATLAEGQVPGLQLMEALVASSSESRLYAWSQHEEEQSILASAGLGAAISGEGDRPLFGTYFNDGTGAKMDYYVKRSVQLSQKCTSDNRSESVVRVVIMNTAPLDAAESLPLAVTGGGEHGVPPGEVQTNVVVYGPSGAHIESVHRNGKKAAFGGYLHASRAVGVVTTQLRPGQSSTLEFTFSNVPMETPAGVVVTPTVQNLKDVILGNNFEKCAS